MVYDSAGNRILGYGGDEGNYVLRGDNWAFNLTTSRWWPIDTLLGYVSPPARVGGNSAYYPETRKLYLFGGTGYRYPMGWFWHDTWLLDPALGTWQIMNPIGNYIPREGGVAVIDEVNNRMIVFGGMVGGGFFNEAWSIGPLDQPNMTIGQLYPGGTPPPAMRHSVAVYDSSGPRMILFSGQDDQGALYNTVWELQLSPGLEQWRTLSAGGQVPPPMYVASSVFDEPNHRMIVFGGNTGTGQINDVYALGPIPLFVEELSPKSLIKEFKVLGIFPNPTQKECIFEFLLAHPSLVEVRVYDVAGRLVRTLTDRVGKAGASRIIWDGNTDKGRPCPSGVYFYELNAEENIFRGRLTITR
jgi:hypothetical protein